MPPARNFTFICGQDDFLVGRLGQERFQALAAEVPDEFSREIISGFAGTVDEVAAAVNRFREAVQTVPMFGGRRAVWLKDINFLADTTPAGRAESTEVLVEDLKQILQGLKPEETAVLITAAPVDRRRVFPKWCEQNADFVLVGGGRDGEGEALAGVALAEARAWDATFAPGAVELLLAKVGANTRLLVAETRKLASYASQPADSSAKAADGPAVITEHHVAEITPNAAEGDFFEAAEAFFNGDLPGTLEAMRRHFFAGGDARPMIASLQNRNRLLLQMRALVDTGDVSIGMRGLDGFARAAATYKPKFGEAAAVKSAYNIFAQHPYYLGKLAGGGKLPSLRRLIDNQHEFLAAFEEIIRRPDDQEGVLRDVAVRCLAG